MLNRQKNIPPDKRFIRQGRLITYGVALFLVYLVYTIEKDKREEDSFLGKTAQQERLGTVAADFPISHVDPDILAQREAGLEFRDIKPGKGLPVLCGEEITIAYEAYLPSGQVFDKAGADAPRKLRLGSGEVIPGMELGLLGMRKNGLRKMIIPARLAYDGERFSHPKVPDNTSIGVQAYILDKTLKTETPTLPLKFYEDKVGKGEAVSCGDKVVLRYVLYDMEGRKLISGAAVGDTPPVLSQAVLGMRVGGQRAAIISPAYFIKTEMDAFFKVAIPENQVLILELEVESMGSERESKRDVRSKNL